MIHTENLTERMEELRKASKDEPTEISYRPFDTRYMYYTQKSECWINSPRNEVMQNYVNRENLGLLLTKAVRDPLYNHVFLTRNVSEVIFISGTTATNAINLLLYQDSRFFRSVFVRSNPRFSRFT